MNRQCIDYFKQFINVIISGVYKKCNYSSEEIDMIVTTSASASNIESITKKSRSSEEFHKLLEEKPKVTMSGKTFPDEKDAYTLAGIKKYFRDNF